MSVEENLAAVIARQENQIQLLESLVVGLMSGCEGCTENAEAYVRIANIAHAEEAANEG